MPDSIGSAEVPRALDLNPEAWRLAALANGWMPVPVLGKRPFMPKWQVECAGADDRDVRNWTTMPDTRENTNSGVLCGVLRDGWAVYGVDLDVPDAGLNFELRQLAADLLGPARLCRIGKAPKAMLVYRAAVEIPKIQTGRYEFPDPGTGEIREGKVEVMGHGQQFVAHGIHPDTRRPYIWTDEDPTTTPVAGLPEVAETALRAFVAEAEARMRAAGARPVPKAERPQQGAAGGATGHARKPAAPRGDATPAERRFFAQANAEALRRIEPWFKPLFPTARHHPRTGAWRVSSRDLGRPDLEEDLSVHPDGVQDWGEERSHTPVSLVYQWGGAASEMDAALSICGRLGLDPAALGWPGPQRQKQQERQTGPEAPKAEQPQRGKMFGRLRVLGVQDALNAPPREYLWDGLVAAGEFSVWWGPPKSGKSFLLLHAAYAMARGTPLWGREVKQTPVLYVACEGETGVAGRIRALAAKHGNAEHFHYVAQVVDLFDPQADLDTLIEIARAFGCRFVVLDTLARTMGAGDENATRDMNAYVKNLKRIQEETGAHLAVVHHCGWNADRARGSIALIAAGDLVVKIAGEDGLPKKAEVEYAKDDEAGMVLGFDLERFELPPYANGRPRWTCLVAERTDPPPAGERNDGKLREEERFWLRDIEALFALPDGATSGVVPECGMPPVRAATREAVRDWLVKRERIAVASGNAMNATERSRLRRMLKRLQDLGKIGLSEQWVWLL